jgi:hypothetical protein
MTNEEINLAVAAIQGFTYVPPEKGHFGKMTYPKWRHSSGAEYVSETPPPFATDWQWCGPLIEKHTISFEAIFIDGPGDTGWETYCNGKSITCDTPQRAICLAVIAAQPTPATLPPEAPIHDNDRN